MNMFGPDSGFGTTDRQDDVQEIVYLLSSGYSSSQIPQDLIDSFSSGETVISSGRTGGKSLVVVFRAGRNFLEWI